MEMNRKQEGSMKSCDVQGFEIRGYYPGVLGKITEMHAVYYHENWKFDISFETQVGSELSIFMKEFDPRKDGFWSATVAGRFAGAIAIHGSQAGSEGVRLRWFIVDPDLQCSGVGTALMKEAILFCKSAGHDKIFLWTFKGLDPARRVYERHGFQLVEEHQVEQWGSNLLEQKFTLDLTRT
jgi:GNAT superfamily N-acetyltransferase